MNEFTIPESVGDDPAFLLLVSLAIRGMAGMKALEHFAIVTIDNWFDDRWVGFPGVFTEYRQFFSAQIPQKYSRGEVLPPFAKSRVTDLVVVGEPSDHLAAVFYVSSQSKSNLRGSLLGSVPDSDDRWEWYVGFKYDDAWKAIRHKNIGYTEFSNFVTAGT